MRVVDREDRRGTGGGGIKTSKAAQTKMRLRDGHNTSNAVQTTKFLEMGTAYRAFCIHRYIALSAFGYQQSCDVMAVLGAIPRARCLANSAHNPPPRGSSYLQSAHDLARDLSSAIHNRGHMSGMVLHAAPAHKHGHMDGTVKLARDLLPRYTLPRSHERYGIIPHLYGIPRSHEQYCIIYRTCTP